MKNITTNMRAGQDILLKSQELEVNGSFIRAENDLEMDAKKIKLEASADRYSAKSRSIGANLGITLWGAEGVSAGAKCKKEKVKTENLTTDITEVWEKITEEKIKNGYQNKAE